MSTDFRPYAAALRAELAKPFAEEDAMTEQDAIERVAKAIRESELRIMPHTDERGGDYSHRYWRTHAAAAIAAYDEWLRERATDDDVVEAMVNAGYAASVNAVWGADEVERTGRQIVAVAHGAALTAALDVMLGKEQADE